MHTVLYLASALGTTAAAKQLALLAVNLPRDRFAVAVVVLGPADGPAADTLRAAGVSVRSVPVRHAIDVSGMRKLRRAVAAANPAVVHAWGPFAVRASRLTGPRVLASAAADPGGGLSGWLTARQLRRAERVVAGSWADAERYRRLGVPGEKLTRVAPAVAPPGSPPDGAAFRRELGLPPHARLIFAGGRLEPAAGLKDAIWAFDILRYDNPALFLVLVGDGPDRASLEEFGRALAFDDFRVRFAGPRPDLAALFTLAEVVWVTHERGGTDLALEAMAAGRPVVGWKTADLGELVEEGETGFLAARSDRAHLAAQTRRLLDEPALGRRIGETGRARVRERFPVARMVEQFTRVYAEMV
jgi:glycosyltransferase involved in cell wall biosynthesis